MRIKVYLLTICVLLSLYSCKKIEHSPGDSIKTPEYTDKVKDSSKVMEEYRGLISKNATPSEIMDFLKKNIINLDKKDADTVIGDGLLTVLKKQLINYQDKLFSDEINQKINLYKMEDLVVTSKIKEPDVKSLIENVLKDKYKIFQVEGMFDFEIDYSLLKKNFANYCSNELSGYIKIMSNESSTHTSEDAGLIITWNELADRVVITEKFLEKYPNSKFIDEIKTKHSNYLLIYLIGMNNTPAFSYEDDIIDSDLLTSYDKTIKRYKDTNLAEVVKEYKVLVKKNNNKKSDELINYADKVSKIKG